MTDLNLRAARIQLYGLIAALVFAIAVAIGLTAGAFTLSFSVLRDLATQGLMPAQWAWIFPAVVDGAILGATIAVVVLSKINGSDEGKKFFVRLLVAVVCISVVGNAFHAYQAAQEAARTIAQGVDIGFTPLAPAAAAAIAVIPPLLVLAFSHGIGILIKAIGNAYREHTSLVQQPTETAPGIAPNKAPAVAVAPTVAAVAPTVAEAEIEPADVEASVAAEAEERAVETPTAAVAEPAAEVVAPAVADVAPVAETVANDAMGDVALFEVIAVPVAPAATPAAGSPDDATAVAEHAPEPTVEELLSFIEQCSDLTENVRETARLKISNPSMSFAAIAEVTGKVAASTALRRYQRAEEKARAAGFTVPPLPDLTDGGHDASEGVAETRELVAH
ncbi:DUF2637 domain-containing protein [Prescottella equi]|uniref:DUF2637 domain-containing protein n=1 Tax=Rhodococcus hoagii TaxID=43767 RepID=UPI00384A8D92